ncbi:hypothetical protein Hanom_Chr06g00524491 [Helianthus anomalus]
MVRCWRGNAPKAWRSAFSLSTCSDSQVETSFQIINNIRDERCFTFSTAFFFTFRIPSSKSFCGYNRFHFIIRLC